MIDTLAQSERSMLVQALAARCRDLGLSLVHAGADGQLYWASDDLPETVRSFVGASGLLRTLIAKCNECNDGETHLCRLCPGLNAGILVCAPRKQERSYLVVLMPGEQLHRELRTSAWDHVGPDVKAGVEQFFGPSRLTHALERQRLSCILQTWYKDLASRETQSSELASLSEELGSSYEVISLLFRIGQRMNVTQRAWEFISGVCHELREVIAFKWVAVRLLPGLLSNEDDHGGLMIEGDVLISRPALLRRTTEILITRDITGAVVLDAATDSFGQSLRDLGERILVHPLMRGERVIGGLFAADKTDVCEDIDSGDIKMIEAAASHLQIFLDNAALYEDVRLMFLGTLDALTASIDAKDPYTCGHSRRVAYMSKQLAEAAGLPPKVVERVHIAGLVHDVGKIGVPESILRKPGRLTDEEFDAIKKHPDIGARILRDIPHFEDILPGVLYHHERFDGRGYPRGLNGEDIPLFGRIIAVADSFDAMSSTRQYRKAMPREKVVEEIRNGAGTQFDPELVPLFLALDYAEYDRMAAEDQRLGETVRHTKEAA